MSSISRIYISGVLQTVLIDGHVRFGWFSLRFLLILTLHLHGCMRVQYPYLYYVVLTGDLHGLLTVIQGSEDGVTSPVDE